MENTEKKMSVSSERIKRAALHWSNLLEGYNNMAKIPADYFNKEVNGIIAKEKIVINEDKYARLKKFSEKQGINITDIVELIYGLILQEYTFERDVMFGSTMNIIPIRITTEENETFVDALKIFVNQKNNSKEYLTYMLSEIEKNSPLDKKLINTIFVSGNVDMYAKDMIDDLMRLKGYEFAVDMVAGEGTLVIRAKYMPSKYSKDTAERVLSMFETVISQIVENEKIEMKDIRFVSREEEEEIFEEFNMSCKKRPPDMTFMDGFYEQVKKTPDNIAISDEKTSMTYRELDIVTERFAGYLNSIGIKREDTVAVILPRNIGVIIAAISIMKAGAAVFPIDISNPSVRMSYLLEDSEAKVIITSKKLENQLPKTDKKLLFIENESMFNTDIPITEYVYPDNCAYRISTSGSTGRPKCMSIEHRSLMNMCMYAIDYINADKNDICGVYLSFSFDAAVKQIFPYLLCGASVDIIPETARANEYTVNEYCEKKKITILAVPTIFAKRFIKNCDNKYLRVLQSGGDKLKGYKERNYKIYNEYGPAEFTVLATSFYVDKEYEKIPIGKPIYNTYAYIFDMNGNICPIGVPGELCLSGIQISRGYMHKEELTKEKFVENPFAFDKYTRFMYKTGDLAKWLEDGNIDCIGRMDSQVKIKGIRVEIYEIENEINNIPEIKSSVCIARPDEKGELYLKAFYVSDEEVDPKKVKNYLQMSLPPYMVPEYIMQIDKIPVTPIGKVNKKKLPKENIPV